MKSYIITEELLNFIKEQNAIGLQKALELNEYADRWDNDYIADSFNRIEYILDNNVVGGEGRVKWINQPPSDGTRIFDAGNNLIGIYQDDPQEDLYEEE